MLASVRFLGSGMTFSLMKMSLMLCFSDFANVMSLDTRMPPAMEKAQPPISISKMEMDITVLLSDVIKQACKSTAFAVEPFNALVAL